tara:strand:+ start:24815 stop:25135 length:321 start_codon:yes stop_codon:yes gene_type:complete
MAYLLPFVISAFFQAQALDLNYYSTQDGLSSNIVYDIFQDDRDFIWGAAENGLNRFDAYEFKAYFHSSSNRNSLSSNVVRSVFQDKEANLWVSNASGLNKYNPKNG